MTKVLIADDDATDRTILRSALTHLGYEVEETCDGDQAWGVLERPGAPELAILDWLMPGLTGPEICRGLRARGDAPYVYVIMLTGLDGLADLVEGMEAGADDYITKPFKARELHARLRAGRRILNLQRDLLAVQKTLEARATHDGLTGLLNHVAIMERLNGELDRAKREGVPVGVILLDLDHFKQVNDRYGHIAGDCVLESIAQRIQGAVRSYDAVGRYGGEEFLVVVPGCDFDLTLQIANRIRREASATPIVIGTDRLTVTISAGAAWLAPGASSEAGLLVERADRALYRAKNLGRNRIEWHSGGGDAVAPSGEFDLGGA